MFMSLELNRFISLLRKSTSTDDLVDVLADFTCWLGLERFAMGHHVDLMRPPRDAIQATNYDMRWIAQVVESGYLADDPIHAISMKTVAGFRWDSIDVSRLTGRQRTILEQAAQYGLVTGYTIPVSLPGEYFGTCSFAARSFDRLRPLALELSGVIATAAFQKARMIMQKRDGRGEAVIPDLRPRDREALILVGRGKTDEEIALIMGTSRWTAHESVERVRRAYGNLPRPSLVLRAVFDNQFSFADVFRR